MIAADWAEGFNDAIKLIRNVWQPLFDDPEASKLLKPIQMLCGEAGGIMSTGAEAELMRTVTDQLGESLIGIQAPWKSQGG